MRSKTRLRGATALVAVLAFAPSRVAAQAFTPPKGVGAVTLAWQFVDNTGHRLSDGTLMVRGQSVTTAAVFDLDYGLTDRLSTTIGIPYVFAKYTGAQPSFSGLPVDACSCWHSSFQDLSLSARYRLGDDTWALTPIAGYGRPSHDYPYAGEAVVGRNLQEARVGVNAVLKLVSFLPKASVHAGYTYSFVEKALQEIKNDRSNKLRRVWLCGDAPALLPRGRHLAADIWRPSVRITDGRSVLPARRAEHARAVCAARSADSQ